MPPKKLHAIKATLKMLTRSNQMIPGSPGNAPKRVLATLAFPLAYIKGGEAHGGSHPSTLGRGVSQLLIFPYTDAWRSLAIDLLPPPPRHRAGLDHIYFSILAC